MVTLVTLVTLLGCSDTLKPEDTSPPATDTDVPTPADTDLPPTDTDVPPPPPADDDGDGFTTDDDCDDADPDSYPGADELCDGVDNNCDGALPVEEQDIDGDGVMECLEVCEAPVAVEIPTLTTCLFEANLAGTPFDPRIEWAMAHEMIDPASGTVVPAYVYDEFPTYRDAMHSPVVFQATDDDGSGTLQSEDTPDIAVIMGVEDAVDDGVLRLISGDGEGVHDSIGWESFTNANGTDNYAPYHYAGLAMGDVDADANVEVVTLVIGEASGLCYPAVYEVDPTRGAVAISLERVHEGGDHICTAHAPALADIDADGAVEILLGRTVMDGELNLLWTGDGGRGWYHRDDYLDGYWNSGAHSFAYDMNGDGSTAEVVAGSTVYNNDGTVFCELGEYQGGVWTPALDGYPSVADVARFTGDIEGEPEIVLTGNELVSLYHGVPDYDPNGGARCLLIDELSNAPEDDPVLAPLLPANANCLDRPARGGPSTIADFDGDGTREIAVAGSCWYSVYKVAPDGFMSRYALAQTLDYSSASTGSTVFDFNGDGAAEVVFSDEEALYVWGVDTSSGLQPFERLTPLLIDENHKSWTIHEYPVVADVDNDGKAEIVMVNASNPTHTDKYGIYVLGSADDTWVTAGQSWNQHAYFVTNLDGQQVGFPTPNYSPYTPDDHNSFRQQANGANGALQAPNLFAEVSTCQDDCGEVMIYVAVGNNGPFISVDPNVVISLYGMQGGTQMLIDSRALGAYVHPGAMSDAYVFTLTSWANYDSFVVILDDPAFGGGPFGQASECNEVDNRIEFPLSGFCP